MDGDRCIGHDGNWYDTDDTSYEWNTSHTPCGDDDND
jgi:hypothetical protein